MQEARVVGSNQNPSPFFSGDAKWPKNSDFARTKQVDKVIQFRLHFYA